MHPEQQANLDACVRKGFAIRLNKKRVTAPDVHEAIDKLLNDSDAKAAVLKFKSQLERWNGPENAAKFLCDTFSG
jgi:UDP:flavonoid glycosyltransferase YjiC (YdhE family)